MIECHDTGAVREIRIARAPVNALDLELVATLLHAVTNAPNEGARALVLSGQPGLFSGGLDVRALLGLDRPGMREFFTRFWRLQAALARSPIPVVAAITGHAPAGGTVLAIYCDYRILAEGPFRIGLNEVEVGLSPGATIQRVFERLLGEHRSTELLVRGALVDPDRALAIGLVDELRPPDQVIPRALEYAQHLCGLPPVALARTRDAARAPIARLFESGEGAWVEEALSVWYTDETQRRLSQLFAKR